MKSEHVKCLIPTVGAIDIKVVVPDLMDNRVAHELATSENTICSSYAIVCTLVCATRIDNVRVDKVVIKFCLVSNLVFVCDLV